MPIALSLDDYECVEQFNNYESLMFRIEELDSTLRAAGKRLIRAETACTCGVYELAWTSQPLQSSPSA